jgi:proteasome-associated ATPase
VAGAREGASGGDARPREVAELQAQVGYLEQEVSVLRRKLADSPRQLRQLEESLAQAQASLAGVHGQNDRLVGTLREARDQIVALKEEVERPGAAAERLRRLPRAHDEDTVDIFTGGRKLRVTGQPRHRARRAAARPGGHAQRGAQRRRGPRLRGAGRRRDAQGGARGRPRAGHRPHRRGARGPDRDSLADQPIKAGDSLLLDARSGWVYERIPKSEVEELVLEEVPDIDYGDIGGLSARSSRSATPSSCRSCTRSCSRSTSCGRPKGVLLYGRPAAARRSSPRRSPTAWPRRSPR